MFGMQVNNSSSSVPSTVMFSATEWRKYEMGSGIGLFHIKSRRGNAFRPISKKHYNYSNR